MRIEKLSLSTRVINGLKIAGIKTDDEIMSMDAKELSESTHLGCKSLVEIYSTLAHQYKPPTKQKFNPENYHLNNLNIKAWQEYCQYRKTIIKKPLKTERGCKLQASLLAKYPYEIQQRMVSQTRDNEWIKIVEVKHENQQAISTTTNRLTPAAQQSADMHSFLKRHARGEFRSNI